MSDLQIGLVFRASAEAAKKALDDVTSRVRTLGGQGSEAAKGTAALARETAAVAPAATRAGAGVDALSTAIGQAGGPIGAMGQQVGGLMQSLQGLTPLMAAATLAGAALGAGLGAALGRGVRAFADFERQQLTTQAVIRATGGAAGRTAEDIDRLSRDIGLKTMASTRDVRAAAAQVLTFRSITGETFDRTLHAAQDLAASGFGTISSSAVQLAKALESPVEGVAALKEAGVSFSTAQREMIRNFVETGRVAEAQNLILKQVEAQVGGSGMAASDGLAGAFDSLTEQTGRFLELVGGKTSDLMKFTEELQRWAGVVGSINNMIEPDLGADLDRMEQAQRQRLERLAELNRQKVTQPSPDAVNDDRFGYLPRAAMGEYEALIAVVTAAQQEIDALRSQSAVKDAETRQKAATEQANIVREQTDGVIAGLQREGEAARMTALERLQLAAVQRAGVTLMSAEGQAIAALVAQNQTLARARDADDYLAKLRAEAEMQVAIAKYGRDSAEVAGLRAAAERRVVEAQLEALGVTGDLAAATLEVYDNGRKFADLDLSGGVAAAASSAGVLARNLGVSLATASRFLAMGGGKPEGVVYDPRDPRFNQTAATMERLRLERLNPRSIAAPAVDGGGSAGSAGGSAAVASNTVAGVKAEAQAAIAAMDLALAGMNEKVRAGLMSAEEGAEGVSQAKRRAAEAIAELIPKLLSAADAAGPKTAASVEVLRAKLRELAGDLDTTATKLGKSLSESFAGNLAALMSGLKSGRDAVRDFGQFVQQTIAKAFADRFTAKFVTPLLDKMLGFLGFADGGTPASPDLAAHRNSIVSSPTAFRMPGKGIGVMGEAGPEAIMPLRRAPGGGLGVLAAGPGGAGVLPLRRTASGALGVVAPWQQDVIARPSFFAQGGIVGSGGGAAGIATAGSFAPRGAGGGSASDRPVTVIVNNNAPATQATATERRENGARIVEVLIDQVQAAIAGNVARGIGPIPGAFEQGYGLNRQGR